MHTFLMWITLNTRASQNAHPNPFKLISTEHLNSISLAGCPIIVDLY